jgi:hypothetical protein
MNQPNPSSEGTMSIPSIADISPFNRTAIAIGQSAASFVYLRIFAREVSR